MVHSYSGVCHVNAMREPPSHHQDQHVHGDEVDQKHVATPGGNLEKETVAARVMQVDSSVERKARLRLSLRHRLIKIFSFDD